jgi:parallel beta-helix repeat protein
VDPTLNGGNTVSGNVIAGSTGYGRFTYGSSNNDILDNTIFGNGGDGVFVWDASTGNAIRGNSIHDNGGLGIELAANANDNQAAPVLTSASLDFHGEPTGGRGKAGVS